MKKRYFKTTMRGFFANVDTDYALLLKLETDEHDGQKLYIMNWRTLWFDLVEDWDGSISNYHEITVDEAKSEILLQARSYMAQAKMAARMLE